MNWYQQFNQQQALLRQGQYNIGVSYRNAQRRREYEAQQESQRWAREHPPLPSLPPFESLAVRRKREEEEKQEQLIRDKGVHVYELKYDDLFELARALLEAETPGLGTFATTGTLVKYNGVRDVPLLDTGEKERWYAGDVLSQVPVVDRKDAYWEKIVQILRREDQSIVIDGEQWNLHRLLTEKLPNGISSWFDKDSDLLDSAVEMLESKATEVKWYEKKLTFVECFCKVLQSRVGFHAAIDPSSTRQRQIAALWAATMNTLATKPVDTIISTAHGPATFEVITYAFLCAIHDDDFYWHSPNYTVNGVEHTGWADAISARALAVEKFDLAGGLEAWEGPSSFIPTFEFAFFHQNDGTVEQEEASFKMDARGLFEKIIKYPEGRNLMWRKEFIRYWICYGCTCYNVLPIPMYKRYNGNDALEAYVSRLEYLQLVTKLDPGNSVLERAIQVAQVERGYGGQLVDFDADLKRFVGTEEATTAQQERPRLDPCDLQKYSAMHTKDVQVIEKFLESAPETVSQYMQKQQACSCCLIL